MPHGATHCNSHTGSLRFVTNKTRSNCALKITFPLARFRGEIAAEQGCLSNAWLVRYTKLIRSKFLKRTSVAVLGKQNLYVLPIRVCGSRYTIMPMAARHSVINSHHEPIAQIVKSFAVGFLCGCLTFHLVSTYLGEHSWSLLCIGECESSTQIVRVYLPYRTPNSLLTNRSVFSTVGNKNLCPTGTLRILVLIPSDPNSLARRNTIRSTWLKGQNFKQTADYRVDAYFIVGMQGLSPNSESISTMKREQSIFHDLLFLHEVTDDYRNLTLKVWMAMKWAYKSANTFDFLVKTDDDSYVRLDKLASTLRKLNCDERLYWGYFIGCSVPQHMGRWAEAKWNICPQYIPYAMGGGYVLSWKVVGMIARHADRLKLYSNEDVTVGSWLAPYKLVRKHDLRFDVESHKHGCNNNYIIAHKQMERRDMEEKYNSLKENGTLCIKENEIRPAYIYNWTALPMECCHRKMRIPVLDIDP